MESSELLSSYIEGIRRLSGAGSVSLYVPPSLSGFSRSTLIHDGPLPPVAELADLETAQGFAERAEGRGGAAGELVASATAGGGLIPLPAVQSAWALAVMPEQIVTGPASPARRRSDAGAEDSPPSAWLGLRFEGAGDSIAERLEEINLPAALADTDERPAWWRWLFAMGGALASHTAQVSAILKDPITGLPDRAGFQAVLSEELEKARLRGRPLSLILVNPDDFAAINERFGRVAGDKIVLEISSRLRAALRGSDPLARYGGVIFAITLADTGLAGARSVAEKLIGHATEAAFLDGAVRLGFSAGVAVFEPEDPEIRTHLDLIRRADQALNAAKRAGGGVVIDWEQRSGAEETGAFDRLSGIFTGNMAKDYRNMVLLSDTIDVIAENQEFDRLAAEVVERLYGTLKPDRVALFTRDEQGEFELMRGLTRSASDSGPQMRVETVSLGARERELLGLAVAEGRPQELTTAAADEESRSAFAVPLIATDESLGCLYVEGREGSLALEAADVIFLRALASQVAVALDRARLAELERRRQETERRKLRAELNELRQALQQAKLVYRSQEMDSLLVTARRVAPTDATILITGESGTGKELLARTIHELSPRNDQPMVVVDCGAIPSTLIESELFGHERGAYTGAQQRRHGRIAEANRGTVLLDEIAELPLETQSKLLRFVQEKQFTTLGGSRQRRVDVRIIAATNRDLGTEVRAGRFREDLYYRLNVVRLEMPPLRDRPDDILHLARHFLETFSVQYQKSIRSLTPAAEDLLLRYAWPGNVRELQNRMMQAVILCETERLGPEELSLPGVAAPQAALPGGVESAPARPAAALAEDQPLRPQPKTLREQFEELRRALGRQIEATGKTPGRLNFPLGRWLGDDLILEAAEAGGGVARRGAAIAGIPETTFRRRLQKASEQNEAGLATRSGTWDEIRQLLATLVRRTDLEGGPLLARTERCLLGEIVGRFPGDVRTGSALLGVTPPTYRRRVAALKQERNGDEPPE